METQSGTALGLTTSVKPSGYRVCAETPVCRLSPRVATRRTLSSGRRTGTPTNLGSLGGGGFNIPGGINNRGEVAGASLAKDGTVHPFLWTKETGMQDLGAFPGAVVTGIPCCGTLNDSGEAVGLTADSNFNLRAWVWRDHTKTDLNLLIPKDSPLYLHAGFAINDHRTDRGPGHREELLPGAESAGMAGQSVSLCGGSCISGDPITVTRKSVDCDKWPLAKILNAKVRQCSRGQENSCPLFSSSVVASSATIASAPHRRLLPCAMVKKQSAAMVTKKIFLTSRRGPKTVLL